MTTRNGEGRVHVLGVLSFIEQSRDPAMIPHPRSAPLLVSVLVATMTGCAATPTMESSPTSPPPEGSAPPGEPSASAVSPSAPPGSVPPTARATPSPAVVSEAFGFGQRLRVTADGLAVRRAPTLSGALVFGAVWDASGQQWIGTGEDVRLDAGYEVRVSLGPIHRDGVTWYRVMSFTQPGQDVSEETRWDADGDDQFGDPAWIATDDGDRAFAQAIPPADGGPVMNAPLVFASGDSGTWESDPFSASMMVAGSWAFVTADLAPCDFEVTLEPIGEVLASDSLIGVFAQGEIASSTNLEGRPYTVRVTAGVPGSSDASCSWALEIGQVIG